MTKLLILLYINMTISCSYKDVTTYPCDENQSVCLLRSVVFSLLNIQISFCLICIVCLW